MSLPARPRLLYVVTHGMTARHLLDGQLAWMRERGFDVAVCASPGADLDLVEERERVRVFPVPISREIAPLADLRAVRFLTHLMRRWGPDVINAGTPKAGLVGMLAAKAAGVPVRLYTLRGLRLETTTGLKRAVLSATERAASACAHGVLAVSPSLAERYVARGLAPARKVRVLGAGASNGVDVHRFACPDAREVARLRRELTLPEGTPVVGFVGRLTADKGVAELARAFEHVRRRVPGARLLLVGDFEAGNPVPDAVRSQIEGDPAVVRAGFVGDPAPYYALMDVLAFPSHREGFPNAPLEAAAAGLPVVGFRATGTVDAVSDGETGLLVGVGDVAGLGAALAVYLRDPDLRRRHGFAGRERARRDFQQERVWEALYEEYDRLLAEAGRPRARPVAAAV